MERYLVEHEQAGLCIAFRTLNQAIEELQFWGHKTPKDASEIAKAIANNGFFDNGAGASITLLTAKEAIDLHNKTRGAMTAKQALDHISRLYPPDSEFPDVRKIGRALMDEAVGNAVGYNNWRDLPERDLVKLAEINLLKETLDLPLDLE